MSTYVSVDISLGNSINDVLDHNELNIKKCEILLSIAQKNIGANKVQDRINMGESILNKFRKANTREQARELYPQILEYLGACRMLVEESLTEDEATIAKKQWQQARLQRKATIDALIKELMSSWQNTRIYNLSLVHLAKLKEQALDDNFSDEQISHALQTLYSTIEQQLLVKNATTLPPTTTHLPPALNQAPKQAPRPQLAPAPAHEPAPMQEPAPTQTHMPAPAPAPAPTHERTHERAPEHAYEAMLVQGGTKEGESTALALLEAIDPYEDHELLELDLNDEENRKHIVKAIYQSLSQAGFIMAKPIKKTLLDGSDVVLIQAARASGNRAEFIVPLNGKLTYKFDHYLGQSCHNDINKVIPKLSEIYGIKFSNERVLWSNPDDESSKARPLSPNTQTKALHH